MTMLTTDVMGELTKPGARLPWLVDWLARNVWSDARFAELKPETYLTQGEKLVCDIEELLSSAADRVFDELAAASKAVRPLSDILEGQTAVVVFDGASIREAPLFRKKAEESGFHIVESNVTFAALPSETVDFVEQRLIGKAIGPKQLPGRQELKNRGVKAFYFSDAIGSQNIASDDDCPLLLWSAFPDVTYKDSDARFARHFAEMQAMYDAAWKNTVMQVPRGRRIIVTSDHGYIFFGAGFESTRPSDACDLLGQSRSKKFLESEQLPDVSRKKDLQIFPDDRLAMVRGRIKNRPKGPSGSLVYRHGGLSLMEMLVPWIVLERR